MDVEYKRVEFDAEAELEKIKEGEDIVQKFARKWGALRDAEILREGEVVIHGVVASAPHLEPQKVMLPQELNEQIKEVVIAYYEKKARE